MAVQWPGLILGQLECYWDFHLRPRLEGMTDDEYLWEPHWRDGVRALDAAAVERPLGPKGAWFADDSMAALVLHLDREIMAHGAEICLLRDLYRDRER